MPIYMRIHFFGPLLSHYLTIFNKLSHVTSTRRDEESWNINFTCKNIGFKWDSIQHAFEVSTFWPDLTVLYNNTTAASFHTSSPLLPLLTPPPRCCLFSPTRPCCLVSHLLSLAASFHPSFPCCLFSPLLPLAAYFPPPPLLPLLTPPSLAASSPLLSIHDSWIPQEFDIPVTSQKCINKVEDITTVVNQEYMRTVAKDGIEPKQVHSIRCIFPPWQGRQPLCKVLERVRAPQVTMVSSKYTFKQLNSRRKHQIAYYQQNPCQCMYIQWEVYKRGFMFSSWPKKSM